METKFNFQKLCDYAEKRRAYINFYAGCSEPGYNDKDMILCNWNNLSDKLFQFLENSGFACEWEDEWTECDSCNKGFRTSPNSYSWQMFGHIFDGYALCGNCLAADPIEFLESLENNPCKALTHTLADVIDVTKWGYKLVKREFEAGMYEYQFELPSPEEILKSELQKSPDSKFIFVMDSQGQFDIKFSLYRKIRG